MRLAEIRTSTRSSGGFRKTAWDLGRCVLSVWIYLLVYNVGTPSTLVDLGIRMRVVVGSNLAQTVLVSTVVGS